MGVKKPPNNFYINEIRLAPCFGIKLTSMITGLYAGILGLIYIRLTLAVIGGRRKHLIAYGYGKNNEIAGVVSAHGNFSAYAPIFLVSLLCLELGGKIVGTNLPLLLHLLGVLFVAGRLIHFSGLSQSEQLAKPNFNPRKIGMHLTIWPLVLIFLANIISYFIQ